MTPDIEFDTGLDARAFAQAKFAHCLIEPGLIVRPGETPNPVELWKASGVREKTGDGGRTTMVVWGPPVEGERLDSLLNGQKDTALAAISLWIQSILALEDTPPLWPSAAIVALGDEGRAPAVFFAPPTLIKRGVTHNDECFVNPALSGAAASAFTAAVMLYRLFAGVLPFSAGDLSALHEDMRDGNFLPVRFAVPGMEPRLAAFMQAALEQRAHDPDSAFAADGGLGEFLAIFQKDGKPAPAASLVEPLSETDRRLLEKEKARFLIIKTASIKTSRFVARNTALLLGSLAAAAAVFLIIYSVIDTRANRPTTAGMDPVQVIETYYRSIGELDHQMMEACVTGDAGKNDINTVVNLFVISKTRQAYERNTRSIVFPAHQWRDGELPDTPLFGAADLRIEPLEGGGSDSKLRYRVDYTYWIPAQAVDEGEIADGVLSLSYPRRDIITLVQKKDKWRIAEIDR